MNNQIGPGATPLNKLDVFEAQTRTKSIAERVNLFNSHLCDNLERMDEHISVLLPQPCALSDPIADNPESGGVLGAIDDGLDRLDKQLNRLQDLVSQLTHI